MANKDVIPLRFGYQWKKYRELLAIHESQFRRWIAPLGPDDFKGKKVLDAGCGMGRNSYWVLQWGAKEVVAIDADPRTVASASENLRGFSNARVHLKSIYDIDWNNEFDIAFSAGVIHHLEDPLGGVKKLVQSVKPEGTVAVWLYGYEGNAWVVRCISPLRRLVTSRLPMKVLDIVAYAFSVPLYMFLRVWPLRHPYYQQLRSFQFRHVHIIVLDHLLPPIAIYYRKDEAEELLRSAGLTIIAATHVSQNSWSVIGRKP